MPVAGALAELPVIAVGLLLLLALFALITILRILDAVIKDWPVIGGWISDNIIGASINGLQRLSSWITSGVGVMVDLIVTPIRWLDDLFNQAVNTFWQIEQGLYRIVALTIPNAINRALDYAHSLALAVEAEAQALFNQAVADARALVDGLRNAVAAELDALSRGLQAMIGALQAQVAVELATLRNAFEATLNQAVATIGAELDLLRRGFDATIAALQAGVNAELELLRRGFEATIGRLRDDVEQEILTVEHALADNIAAEAAIAAAATAVVAKELTDYLQKCGNPLCKGGLDLANMLGELGELIDDGLLLALAAMAAHDPKGTGEAITGFVGGLAHDIETAVGDAIGVRAA